MKSVTSTPKHLLEAATAETGSAARLARLLLVTADFAAGRGRRRWSPARIWRA